MSEERASEQGLIQVMRGLFPAGAGVRIGIGDDCAVLDPTPGNQLLVTTDFLLEDIHFRRSYASPADIGWKALAVNLSDIAAMGGVPRWAVIALACPDDVTDEAVAAFAGSMAELAAAHGVAVVGGDTTASPHGWAVNVTVVGETARAPKLRSGARPGDLIAVTGPLGRSAAGLARLEQRPDARDDLSLAHLRPVPRVREGQALGALAGVSAMVDLSDGLATDLAHVAAQSRVGARVDLVRLPIDPATRAAAATLGTDPVGWATGGGEDYELLVTLAPDALAEATRLVSLTVIGQITAAASVEFVDADGAGVVVGPGYQHFAPPSTASQSSAPPRRAALGPPAGSPFPRA